MAKKKTASPIGDAVIYARYSDRGQREESIEQQVDKAMRYAEFKKLNVIEVYSDKAVSGRTDRRPSFQRMLRDAEKGKFAYVIAWKSNRMGRNMMDAMINDARLMDFGVKCVYVEEDFDDSAAGRFALRNMMNVNQFYSENLAEDVRRGMMYNAENCFVNGKVSYGYRAGPDKRYAIEPEEAEIVREIFTRILNGEAENAIADSLNARGLKTSTGRIWARGSFATMLRNEQYIGVYSYNGIKTPGGIPRIISDDLFYSVQEVLKVRKQTRGRKGPGQAEYPLTGKLFCGHCGSPMYGISGTSSSTATYYYYACRKKHTEKACDKKNIRKDVIEEKITRAIIDHLLTSEVIDWIVQSYEKFVAEERQNSLLATFESELSDAERSIKNLLKIIEQGTYSDAIAERLHELEGEKKALTAKIAAEKLISQELNTMKVRFWLKSFADGDAQDPTYQKKLFDTFISAVYLYDDHFKIIHNLSGENSPLLVPFDVDSAPPDSSYNCKSGVPDLQYSNFSPTIYLVGNYVVLVAHL